MTSPEQHLSIAFNCEIRSSETVDGMSEHLIPSSMGTMFESKDEAVVSATERWAEKR